MLRGAVPSSGQAHSRGQGSPGTGERLTVDAQEVDGRHELLVHVHTPDHARLLGGPAARAALVRKVVLAAAPLCDSRLSASCTSRARPYFPPVRGVGCGALTCHSTFAPRAPASQGLTCPRVWAELQCRSSRLRDGVNRRSEPQQTLSGWTKPVSVRLAKRKAAATPAAT